MAVLYTTVERIYDKLAKFKGVTDLTSQDIALFATGQEAYIHARLAGLYTLPFSDAPLIKDIADDLTVAQVLTVRIFPQTQLKKSDWPEIIRGQAMKMLDQIGEGTLKLVDSSGSLIAAGSSAAEVWSNNMDYEPTFTELGIEDQVIDPDKLEDLADARNLTTIRDRLK